MFHITQNENYNYRILAEGLQSSNRKFDLHKNGTRRRVYLNEVGHTDKFILLNVIYRVYLLRKKS